MLEDISSILDILVAMIGGYCALQGISYLEDLKRNKVSAIFSFWAQLSVRLLELRTALSDDERIISGLYDKKIQESWIDTRGAPEQAVSIFYQNVKETLQFIKGASNQMPAYKNWMKDYQDFITFLVECIQYDIRDLEKGFKFTEQANAPSRTTYCDTICDVIDRLLDGIKKEQELAAEQVYAEEN